MELCQYLIAEPRCDNCFGDRLYFGSRERFLLLLARGRFSRAACEEAARRTEGFTMA